MIEELKNNNTTIPKLIVSTDFLREIKKDSEHTESPKQNNYIIDETEIKEKKKKTKKSNREIAKFDVRPIKLEDYDDDSFIQFPRWLLECDLNLTIDEKILYVLLSDRYKLSLRLDRKEYKDKGLNRIFELFTEEEIVEIMGIGRTKCYEMLDNLVKAGLIIKKGQGKYRPNKIFVNRLTDDEIALKKRLKEDCEIAEEDLPF